MLWHMPTASSTDAAEPRLSEAVPGPSSRSKLRVLEAQAFPRGNTQGPLQGDLPRTTQAASTSCSSTPSTSSSRRQLPVGKTRFVSGRDRTLRRNLQMAHPDYIVPRTRETICRCWSPSIRDRRALGQDRAKGGPPGASIACPNCRSGRSGNGSKRAIGRLQGSRLRVCTGRRGSKTYRAARRPGNASPTMSCLAGQLALALVSRTSRADAAAAFRAMGDPAGSPPRSPSR